MLRPDRLTLKAREAVQAALEQARTRGNPVVNDAHLLSALLGQDEGIVQSLLAKAGVSVPRLSNRVEGEITGFPTQRGTVDVTPTLDRTLSKVFARGENIAKELGDAYVSTEHLLLALAEEKGTSARQMLEVEGLTPKELRTALDEVRGSHRVTDETPEQQYQALERFTRNLTDSARSGKLDPVIGRDEEVRRVMQVLSRRTKNNPVLIGEPGVGKTAIVEGPGAADRQRRRAGFAQEQGDHRPRYRPVAGRRQVPRRVRGAAQVGGEGADRRGGALHRIHRRAAHTGWRREGRGVRLTRPTCSSRRWRAVNCTWWVRRRSTSTARTSRRTRRSSAGFQPVYVGEPSVEDTIAILRGLKEKYEVHHGVRITDNALVAAATLSHRYIGDRFLPDKAIDLMDEAASRIRMEIDSLPQEIDEVERRILQLEIERQSLLREKDKASVERRKALEQEIAEAREKSAGMKARWQSEKQAIESVQKKKAEVEALRTEVEQATRAGDLQKAAELRYGRIPELERAIAAEDQELAEIQKSSKYLREEVGPEDIAQVVAKWTGIPVTKMLESDRERLTRLESELARRVVGQPEALAAVSNAVRRARAGLQDVGKPTGSFIFLGPTGVGKTETARALAEFLFDDERALVRLDMSEYMEKHAVARMIGAPPGYIGYEEGGQLTEAVRRRPYCVILFDEIEKAHPDVFNLLLQVLDDGRLTDSQGRVVDFRNTVIIMTSNIGSRYLLETKDMGPDAWPEVEAKVLAELRAHFRPEFLNRVDDIVVFRPLTREDLDHIVALQLAKLRGLVSARGLVLEVSAEAMSWLAEAGYDPLYGARPLKRVIQRELQNPIAMRLLEGKYNEGDTIRIGVDETGLTFSEG